VVRVCNLAGCWDEVIGGHYNSVLRSLPPVRAAQAAHNLAELHSPAAKPSRI